MPKIEMEDKLKRVLDTFLEPNYRVADEIYLEKLLSHFSGEDCLSGDVFIPVCTEWLQQLVESSKSKALQPSLAAFTSHVVALLVRDAQRFNYLQKEEVVDKVIKVLNLRETENTSVKLAYISLLSALVKHRSGCDYLIKSDIWRDAVKYCHKDASRYVTRNGQKFTTDLLNTMLAENSTTYETVLNFAFGPLIVNHPSKKSRLQTDDEHLSNLVPTLEMACHVLEDALLGACTSSHEIFTKYNFESLALAMLNTTQDTEVVEKIAQLLTLIYFTSLESKNKSGEIVSADFKEFQTKLYNLLSLLMSKGLTKNCIKVIVKSQYYWHKTSLQVPKGSDKQYVFENQLIILQLMPIICSLQTTKISENECLDSYANKLFELTSENTQRLAYTFRDLVAAENNGPELAHVAVLHVMQIRDIMHRDQAVIVFQALMYMVKDFVPELYSDDVQHSSSDLVIRFPELLSSVLETVTSLIRCFHITWRESVETICVFTLLHLLLKNPNLTSKLAVQTLQLMQEVILSFMPPNLALLVNTLEGSTISQLGPQLFRRMHDRSWEVRDSALEVLRVVANISEVKFTAFQEHVLENKLCSLCVTMAVDDAESYARASALSCLGIMVRVHKYWTESLSTQNLPGKIMAILQSESEGIVRREAATLMNEMYEHQRISKSMLEEVFTTMAAVTTGDLHWEVQVNALDFWKKVISHQMSNQGMIDGVFPSVTFSREDRKIVTLTKNEIRNRLGKVLQELSQRGCLQVLLTSLEDCNVEVVQKAVTIVTSLSQLLSQHEILPAKAGTVPLPDLVSSNCVKPVKSEMKTLAPIFDTFAHEHHVSVKPIRCPSSGEIEQNSSSRVSEQVIESIVMENDMKLLEQVYQNKLNMTYVKKVEVVSRIVSVDEFLATLSKLNLGEVLRERTRWLDYCHNALGSLLDDILASSVERESNAIDCY